MAYPHFPGSPLGSPESILMTAAVIGGLAGGLASSLISYFFSKRIFRAKVLDAASKDIKVSLSAYTDWLTAVSSGFALWKSDLLPAYLPDSPQDQFELNRMRVLFVDQRNQAWLAKLEEYDTLLGKFNPVIKAMWFRQMEIQDRFADVYKSMESDPPEAVKTGESIEGLAFEQGQLASDFLYHLQCECHRPAASAKPRAPRDAFKTRIVRTALGRIRMVSPKDTL